MNRPFAPTDVLAAFLAGSIFSSSPVVSQVNLATQADATIRSDQPTSNFGTSTELGFGKDQNASSNIYFMRTFFRFDVTPLLGKPVTRATLHFHETRTLGAGGQEVSVYRLTQAFSETTVTWNSKPNDDNVIVARFDVGDNRFTGWKNIDVTPLVDAWVRGRVPNHGLVVRLEQETTAGTWRPGWAPSREFPVVTERPILSVDISGVRTFEMGCGPVATWPRMWVNGGAPQINTAMAVAGHLLSPSTLGMTAIGFSNTVWRGIPLPITIDPIPGPACKLLVAPDVLIPGTTNSSGQMTLGFTIPNDPRLLGTRVYLQMATRTPLHMTEGLELVIH